MMDIILMSDLHKELDKLLKIAASGLFIELKFKIDFKENSLRWLCATSEINIIGSKSREIYYTLPVTTSHLESIRDAGFSIHKFSVKECFTEWLLSKRRLLDEFTLKENNYVCRL